MSFDPNSHRKTVKHYHEPGDLHLLTFSCYRRMALLTNDPWRVSLGQAVREGLETYRYRLAAYVFMPEHVHLLVYPLAKGDDIDDLLKAIKRPHSSRVKKLLIEAESDLLKTLTIRQRPGVTTFRYWQEGPGHDSNIQDAEAALAAIDYIHMNPVKRKLVERAVEWKWSSARWYLRDPDWPPLPSPVVHGLPAEYLA